MAPSTSTTSASAAGAADAQYYKLNIATLPDDLYNKKTPVEDWLQYAESTHDPMGFPPHSLNQRNNNLDRLVEYERLIGISLYMIGNVSPFAILLLGVGSLFSTTACYTLLVLLTYIGILYVLEKCYFAPIFLQRYQRGTGSLSDHDIADNQYLFTERNTSKYMNTTVVWPQSLHPLLNNKKKNNNKFRNDQPVIFCLVPHGVAPLGATAYPMWSKIWSTKLCHWTCAPIVLQLPYIGYFMNKIGYIPAKSQPMIETLTKKEESVEDILVVIFRYTAKYR